MTQSPTYDPNAPSPLLLWDTGFTPVANRFDWRLDGDTIQDDMQLHTAIMLCLFTDARAPEDRDLPGDKDDPRGWWGDKIDVRGTEGEADLGSLLWLYERAALTPGITKDIEDTAREALQPLVDQGMVAEISVEVEVNRMTGHVYIGVQAFSQSGQKRYDQKFSRVWGQVLEI